MMLIPDFLLATMQILIFLLRRAAQLVLLTLLVALAIFLLSSVIPGDFYSTHLLDSSMRAEAIEQLRHRYGLDQPVYVQYLYWLKNLARLDLGYSLFYQRPVAPVVADALAKTLWMGVPALILGFGGGIMLGTLHGIMGRRLMRRLLDIFSAVALSLPSLLLGLGALLFAAHTQWFPLGGMNSLDSQGAGLWQWTIDRLHHLLLPVACLTIPIFAYVERIQCASTQNSCFETYVRSARSRGLGSLRIFFQYILYPGLNPVLSISGPMLGGILSGSLVLEVIFSWPGLGQITYDSLFNSDLFLLAGCIMGSSVLLVIGNLLADLAVMVLDPRTRAYARKGLR
jgi:peptide/nickel transport system permease protein